MVNDMEKIINFMHSHTYLCKTMHANYKNIALKKLIAGNFWSFQLSQTVLEIFENNWQNYLNTYLV